MELGGECIPCRCFLQSIDLRNLEIDLGISFPYQVPIAQCRTCTCIVQPIVFRGMVNVIFGVQFQARNLKPRKISTCVLRLSARYSDHKIKNHENSI